MITQTSSITHCAVILPVYNPAADWATVAAEQYNSFLQLLPVTDVRLVIVNDGSAGTVVQEGIQQLKTIYPDLYYLEHSINRGKGYALRQAVAAVSASCYLLTDVDLPYKPESMLAVYNELQLTTTVAAGNRNAVYYQQIGNGRHLLSKLLRFSIRSMFGISIDDTQCGLKGFTADARTVFLSCITNRYLYDLEFIVRAHKAPGIRIKAVPVQLREGIELRSIAWRVLLQEIKSFITILKIRYSK